MTRPLWPSSSEPKPIVVLGIGNLLRGDEGVGIHALRRLVERHRLAEPVRALDGGVMGMELVTYLEGCTSLLIIDAVDAGQAPGSIVRLAGPDLPAAREGKLSMHQAGLLDLLGVLALQDRLPNRLVVWGIQPAALDWTTDLSPTVQAAMDRLLEGIADDLRAWKALA